VSAECHSPGNSWGDESEAREGAERTERKLGCPITARQCPECERWVLHVVWHPKGC